MAERSRVLIAGGGTGGHLVPALAIAGELRARGVEAHLVGAERGIERRILPGRDLGYTLLPFEPIYRYQWWRNLGWPRYALRIWKGCTEVLSREQPDVVVGTGGYAAGPMLLAASRRRIPIALQEQNAFPGITTRLLARRASAIYLGFPESRARLKGDPRRVHVFGNPVQPPPDQRDRAAARRRLGLPSEGHAVLIMGGSQGARAINDTVAAMLESGELDDELAVLWSTGAAHFDELSSFESDRVRVRAFWDPIGVAYEAASLVVARAGAMTTAELCAWGLPSVLIPLPSAAADHQSHNAAALEQAGAALTLREGELTHRLLADTLQRLLSDPGRIGEMSDAARSRGHPNAVREIVSHLLDKVS